MIDHTTTTPLPDLAALRDIGEEVRLKLQDLKRRVEVPDYGWYPYESILALPVLLDLLDPSIDEIGEAITTSGMVDLGCADGDLAVFFSSIGCRIDAIDHAKTNYNQLRGLQIARNTLAPGMALFDIDLDQPFDFPQRDYGLALFLGTLYHLRNPLYVLDKLSSVADWCLLSTRIAQVSPGQRTRIEGEPVAYLLGAREANNDPTNFWIFSFTGLARLLERAGWVLTGYRRVGCTVDSNPVDANADERIFVLAKSRVRYSGVQVRLLQGWHSSESGAFRWTEKRFELEVTVPDGSQEFAMRFTVPDAVVASGSMKLSCSIAGTGAGTMTCDEAGTFEFRGRFPERVITHQLQFVVESCFQPENDRRELGICVPLASESRGTQQIGFRVS